ncbi:MAG: N-acetyl-gamma-glutamyl-phosphate reductase [Hydrotalea sp.]|nr:N-acetyl-gamma-glutamyl-phosphate reductase [Hydrotalea sp.]
MVKKRIFIDGAEGTTGLDIRERLAAYNRESGDRLDIITLPDDLRKDKKHRALNLNDCDVAILCLPDDAARDAVAMVDNPAVKILDCSTAHRISHGWVYGLPEYNQQQPAVIGKSPRVANPGCYATGFILLVAPLKRAGLIPDDYPLAAFGLSGYSGGGKTMMAEYETPNKKIHGHVYGLQQNHKHLAEMADYGLLPHPPLFQPVVGDFPRGMVMMVPLDGRVLTKINQSLIEKIWVESYGGCEKILLGDESPSNSGAVGQRLTPSSSGAVGQRLSPSSSGAVGQRLLPDEFANRDDIKLSVLGNDTDGRLTLTAQYDNLGKGASGAALQNVRLMLGM